jgi:hypothetical protein
MRRGTGPTLDPETTLRVVFSGSDRRSDATVERLVSGDDEDLALLHIEPFDGMPHMDGPDLAMRPPQPGTDGAALLHQLGIAQAGTQGLASWHRPAISGPYFTAIKLHTI